MRRALGPSLALVALAAGCGEGDADRAGFLWEQRCAPCHAVQPGEPSPAVDEGAPGMPPDLVGGDDVDLLIEYLERRTR